MNLLEIGNNILNEAPKNPLSAFRAIFKAAGINFAEAEAALLLGLKQIDNTISSLNKATPEQIENAFKTNAFKKYSQTIARNYIANNDKVIDRILNKYSINTTQGSKLARAEIANTLKINKSITNEIFQIKKPKVKNTKLAPETNKKLTPGQSFLKGVGTIQAPFLASRYAFRNIPIPGLRGYIRNRTTKLTSDEIKRIGLWFFSGIGDAKSIYDIFKKNGLPLALVNAGGQVFSKWLFWSCVFSSINLILDLKNDVNKPVYEDDFAAFWDRLSKAPEAASLGWLFPIKIVYQQILAPLFKGGIIPFHTKQYRDKLEEIKIKAEKYKEDLENRKNRNKEKLDLNVD